MEASGEVDSVDSATAFSGSWPSARPDPVDSATAFPLFTRVKLSALDESDSPFDSPFHVEQTMNIPLVNDHDPSARPVTGPVPGSARPA